MDNRWHCHGSCMCSYTQIEGNAHKNASSRNAIMRNPPREHLRPSITQMLNLNTLHSIPQIKISRQKKKTKNSHLEGLRFPSLLLRPSNFPREMNL